MPPALQSKKDMWLMRSRHLHDNVFSPNTNKELDQKILRSTPNNYDVQQIFQNEGLRVRFKCKL